MEPEPPLEQGSDICLIPGIFEGINVTVFAYGATDSGKTYTMQLLQVKSA